MGRAPCCDKSSVKKGPWSEEEDKQLKEYIEKHGTGGNWIALPLKAGLKRCGKSCRLRWLNYLRPNIKHGDFSPDEDSIICSLYASIGSRWSIMASQLPGRTDNDIKNYWNTKLKKKLLGISPRKRQRNCSSQVIGGIAAAASATSPYPFDSLAPPSTSPHLTCSFINGQEHLRHRAELMGLENMLLGSASSSPSLLSSNFDEFEEAINGFGTNATVSRNYECNDYLNDPNCSGTGEVSWTASCMYF